MQIVALVHTEGVLLSNKYVILELAYCDLLGIKKHFLIQSPISYTKAKKSNKYLNKSLEVIMCVSNTFGNHKVYKFGEVCQFLKERYFLLKFYFGSNIRFGYKGKSFQRDIFVKCNIPSINIEFLKIPCIKKMMSYFPFIEKNCIYHVKSHNKCAEHVLRLITAYFYYSSLNKPLDLCKLSTFKSL